MSRKQGNASDWKLGRTIGIFLVLVFYATKIITCTADEDQCDDEERSQRGFALLNYTYKSFFCGNYPSCLKECTGDPRCMSLNYWWYRSQCDLNNRTKYSAGPRSFKCDHSSTYMGMKREPGAQNTVYRSCNDVHPSCGDGEYSIDPTSSGNSFTVYCDTTTDGGGWTLILRTILQSSTPPSSYITANHYRDLSKYKLNNQLVPSPVLLQLRQDMGYTQLRLYCYKKQVGTVFHIMTNNNNSGEAVVKFFTDDAYKAARPQACGSFTVLSGDNSTLSVSCGNWGWSDVGPDSKWSSTYFGNEDGLMLYEQAAVWAPGAHSISMRPPNRLQCDDYWKGNNNRPLSSGDSWAVYVR